MPVASPITRDQARDRALVLLRMPNDGAVSPQTLMIVEDQLAAAQQEVFTRHTWLCDRGRHVLTTTPGRRWYNIDADVVPGRIDRVTCILGGAAFDLARAATRELELADNGTPAAWVLRTTHGVVDVRVGLAGIGFTDGAACTVAGGAPEVDAVVTIQAPGGDIRGCVVQDGGAVYQGTPTITPPTGSGAALIPVMGEVLSMLIAPTPDQAYTLWIDFLRAPRPLEQGTDPLSYDTEAVVRLAAAMSAEVLGLDHAQILRQRAEAYILTQRGLESDGAPFRLVSRRR